MIEGNINDVEILNGQIASSNSISGNVNQTQGIDGNTNVSTTIEGNIGNTQTIEGQTSSSEKISGSVKQTQGISGNINTSGTSGTSDYNELNNKPSINGTELKGNLTTEQLKLLYEKLLNLPKINGKELIGDLTTEDLGITDINIIDTFNYTKRFNNNDIYNANASNGIVDFVIVALLEALNREYFVSVNVVVNPLNYQVISQDGDYSDIKHAFDIGGSIRCVCQLAGTNTNVVLNLSMIDNNYAYFTTVMKANLGAGEMKYLIALSISARNTTVQIDVLQ